MVVALNLFASFIVHISLYVHCTLVHGFFFVLLLLFLWLYSFIATLKAIKNDKNSSKKIKSNSFIGVIFQSSIFFCILDAPKLFTSTAPIGGCLSEANKRNNRKGKGRNVIFAARQK